MKFANFIVCKAEPGEWHSPSGEQGFHGFERILKQREFDGAICAALRAAQMAKNRSRRDAAGTIFRLHRTGVNTRPSILRTLLLLA
jgi:hypothetical protein